MGADWSAKTVLGVKVPEQKLYTTVRVPGCAHPKGEKDACCPHCGAKAWKELREPISGYDPDKLTLGAFAVVKGTHSEHGATETFIAFRSLEAEENKQVLLLRLDDELIAKAKSALRTDLESHGLWDESQFGIWCILYCSY